MRWMKRALLLAALASIVAVGPGIGPAPAVAAEAGAAVEFEWSYRYAGGKAGRAAVEQAVDEVVADMNVMIRGIARRKLLEANEVVGELGFSLGGDPLVASFVGGRIIESPRGGAAVEWVDQFGDTVKVSQRWSNGKLVQRIFDANGSRTNVYRFGDDGRMTMSVTIEAAQLPKPLRYRLSYRKAQ